MLKFCLKQWDKNKDKLRKTLETEKGLNECDYKWLVEIVVKDILNCGEECSEDRYESSDYRWNEKCITEIDDGDYQGTLIYIIPKDTYQPSEYEYLMTFVGYGSCSGCDTLMAIQKYGDDCLTSEQVKDFMGLCKDIVANIVKPYNKGWYHKEDFDEVEYE